VVDSARFILIGRLGRSRGVDGEIYVTPLTDFPDRFRDLQQIYLDEKGSWRTIKIERVRFIAGRPILKLEEINNPEDAGRLTNRNVAVTADQLVELPEGSHWVFDLVGCNVFDEADGRRIGEVIDVLRYPANDAYVIKTDDGREILFPAVSEYVKEIDANEKKIVVRSAGLFDDSGNKSGP